MSKNNNEIVKETKEIKENKEVKENKKSKIKVQLPIDPLNPKDTKIKVSINGKDTEIERGKMVEIEENVYKVLINAGIIKE